MVTAISRYGVRVIPNTMQVIDGLQKKVLGDVTTIFQTLE